MPQHWLSTPDRFDQAIVAQVHETPGITLVRLARIVPDARGPNWFVTTSLDALGVGVSLAFGQALERLTRSGAIELRGSRQITVHPGAGVLAPADRKGADHVA